MRSRPVKPKVLPKKKSKSKNLFSNNESLSKDNLIKKISYSQDEEEKNIFEGLVDAKFEISEKASRFIDYYLVHFNASRAAREAGFSKSVSNIAATRFLQDPRIRTVIEERKRILKDRYADLQDRIIETWSAIAFADIKQMFTDDGKLKPIKDIPEELFLAINSIDTEKVFEGRGKNQLPLEVTKIRFEKRLEALNALGKHLNMFEADNSILVDVGFKGIMAMLPPEQREAVKLAALKQIENKG